MDIEGRRMAIWSSDDNRDYPLIEYLRLGMDKPNYPVPVTMYDSWLSRVFQPTSALGKHLSDKEYFEFVASHLSTYR